jgi:transcriptional regulator with XRE-family HTH domain
MKSHARPLRKPQFHVHETSMAMQPGAPSSPRTRAKSRAVERASARGLRTQPGAAAAPSEHAADAAVGARARAIRREKGLLLDEAARRMGVSIGYLSQIERGLSSPSLRVLLKLAETLGASWADLFSQPGAAGASSPEPVVRAHERGELALWRTGVTKQLLTPSTGSALHLYMMEFAPGASSGEELYAHAGEEAGLVLEGVLTLTVETQSWTLTEGDSYRFVSHRPHRFHNDSPVRARVLSINVGL